MWEDYMQRYASTSLNKLDNTLNENNEFITVIEF